MNPRRAVSLARALSKLGVLSRSQAQKAIAENRVRCNGQIKNNPEFRVDLAFDRLSLDGVTLDRKPQKIYLMLNKPRGLVTTRADEKGRATVFECLQEIKAYIFPVGRLDAESEGLLLFTNDSRFAESISNPLAKVPKTYEVHLNRAPSAEELEKLSQGIRFPDGELTRPKSVRALPERGESVIEIILLEGKNREIRRICEAQGFEVKQLLRVRIGDLELGELPPGKTRVMTARDIELALGGKPIRDLRRPRHEKLS